MIVEVCSMIPPCTPGTQGRAGANGQAISWRSGREPSVLLAVQEELEKDLLIFPVRQIGVYMPDTGSGYGGKHTAEAG